MSNGNSVINFGDVSKPATVLIEKISSAIGVLYEPTRIRKEAQANADAAMIEAKGQIEITDLTRRAMGRFVTEETKKQQNIEDITRLALPGVNDDAETEQVSEDWIADFFDKCRLISDTDMQQLWAKVLAGEANSPGNFSKRTIGILAALDKADAQLFNSLCSFVWSLGGLTPLIYDITSDVYTKAGLSYGKLMHLSDIGLVNFNTVGTFSGNIKPGHIVAYYFGQEVTIGLPTPGQQMDFGSALLSKSGAELAPVCSPQPSKDFFNYITKAWLARGYTVAKTLPLQKNLV
jgi:hypothetical protein